MASANVPRAQKAKPEAQSTVAEKEEDRALCFSRFLAS
jgi:hypothetical protein